MKKEDFKWVKIGSDGEPKYTWIAYGDAEGKKLNKTPDTLDGGDFMYLAFNKDTPSHYQSLRAGEYNVKLHSSVMEIPDLIRESLYTWFKFADDESGTNISNDPSGKLYIGIGENKNTPISTEDPTDYKWIKMTGEVVAGKTLYTWFKYSEHPNGKDMYDQRDTKAKFIGVAYNKELSVASSDPIDYVWIPVNQLAILDKKNYSFIAYSRFEYGFDKGAPSFESDPDKAHYIGLSVNNTNPIQSKDPNAYLWFPKPKGAKGDKGDTGSQGPRGYQGADGQDGQDFYTWIRYSNYPNGRSPDGQIDVAQSPAGKKYLGISVNQDTATESQDPDEYDWIQICGSDGKQGPQGEQGIQGIQGIQGPKGDRGYTGHNGADGETLYTWIQFSKYANGQDATTGAIDVSDNATGRKFLGITGNRDSDQPSKDPAEYEWIQICGDKGDAAYVHVVYSNHKGGLDSSGNPQIHQNASTASWMGISKNTHSPTKSNNPSDYEWIQVNSGLEGPKGEKGDPGPRGPDGIIGLTGENAYLHVRYSQYYNGKNPSTQTATFSATPDSTSRYIGLSKKTDKRVASSNADDYNWIKFATDKSNTWVRFGDDYNLTQHFTGKQYLYLGINKLDSNPSNRISDYIRIPINNSGPTQINSGSSFNSKYINTLNAPLHGSLLLSNGGCKESNQYYEPTDNTGSKKKQGIYGLHYAQYERDCPAVSAYSNIRLKCHEPDFSEAGVLIHPEYVNVIDMDKVVASNSKYIEKVENCSLKTWSIDGKNSIYKVKNLHIGGVYAIRQNNVINLNSDDYNLNNVDYDNLFKDGKKTIATLSFYLCLGHTTPEQGYDLKNQPQPPFIFSGAEFELHITENTACTNNAKVIIELNNPSTPRAQRAEHAYMNKKGFNYLFGMKTTSPNVLKDNCFIHGTSRFVTPTSVLVNLCFIINKVPNVKPSFTLNFFRNHSVVAPAADPLQYKTYMDAIQLTFGTTGGLGYTDPGVLIKSSKLKIPVYHSIPDGYASTQNYYISMRLDLPVLPKTPIPSDPDKYEPEYNIEEKFFSLRFNTITPEPVRADSKLRKKYDRNIEFFRRGDSVFVRVFYGATVQLLVPIQYELNLGKLELNRATIVIEKISTTGEINPDDPFDTQTYPKRNAKHYLRFYINNELRGYGNWVSTKVGETDTIDFLPMSAPYRVSDVTVNHGVYNPSYKAGYSLDNEKFGRLTENYSVREFGHVYEMIDNPFDFNYLQEDKIKKE